MDDFICLFSNKDFDWVTLVDEYPNSRADDLREDPIKHKNLLGKKRDAFYALKLFDVFAWWKNVGLLRFPKLAIVASILLAKPFHNGYQERVFSRGTATDNILRKRLREDHYEMRVLDLLTRQKISALFSRIVQDSVGETPVTSDAKVVREFFETGKRKAQRCDPVPIVLPTDIPEIQPHDDSDVSSLEDDEFSTGSSESDIGVNREFCNALLEESSEDEDKK